MSKPKIELKNIGIQVRAPKKSCSDKNCPFHGDVRIRGKMFTGTVVKTNLFKTAVVEWAGVRYIQKYGRYEKRRTRIKVHNPECINAKKGDGVRIAGTRPVSKTKNMVIIEIVGRDRIYEQKANIIEEEKEKIEGKKEPKAKEEKVKE